MCYWNVNVAYVMQINRKNHTPATVTIKGSFDIFTWTKCY